MPTIEEVREKINANPLFVQMQLDGYCKWTVCPGCGDLYAYKQNQERDPIFLEHEEFEYGRCQSSKEANVPLDGIEDVALLQRAQATFEYCEKKRDKWLADQDDSDTPSEG